MFYFILSNKKTFNREKNNLDVTLKEKEGTCKLRLKVNVWKQIFNKQKSSISLIEVTGDHLSSNSLPRSRNMA